MKQSQKIRMVLDAAMIIMLPLLMAYSLLGEAVHEYLGIVMFILFIGHHVLNAAWWKNLLKGRYTAGRILGTVVNIFLAVIMVALPISGIMMSRYAFSSLNLSGVASLARTIHMLAAYWGFVLMSFHVGLHGTMFLNMAKRAFRISKASKRRTLMLRLLALALSAYGIYSFIHRQLADYMFLRTPFVFFDFTEPFVFFMVDYISIMLLFAIMGYYVKSNRTTLFFTQKSTSKH